MLRATGYCTESGFHFTDQYSTPLPCPKSPRNSFEAQGTHGTSVDYAIHSASCVVFACPSIRYCHGYQQPLSLSARGSSFCGISEAPSFAKSAWSKVCIHQAEDLSALAIQLNAHIQVCTSLRVLARQATRIACTVPVIDDHSHWPRSFVKHHNDHCNLMTYELR